jgi:hypothetical protein
MSRPGVEVPILDQISELREIQADLEKLDVPELQARAGSRDPEIAQEAERELLRRWNLQPEKDPANAETVDLMEEMERYSEEERRAIASNLVGLQLTEGCNGNCAFCLFGHKKGVEKKFSFESITRFLQEYADEVPSQLLLYWDSDPFDYQDGDHNYTDIFKVWRKIKPNDFQYVSTTIPKGSQENFFDFMVHAAQEFKAGQESGASLKIRLSIGRHNAQRVEASFEMLVDAFVENGLNEEEINAFIDDCVVYVPRISPDDLDMVGPLIHRRDDIKDVITPACSDGTLLTPKGSMGIIMTAPSIYEPSGQKDILLEPGQAMDQVPDYVRIFDFAYFTVDDSLPARTEYRQTMLIELYDFEGKEYQLPDEVEDVSLKLGRESAAIGRLIIDFTSLFEDKATQHSEQQRQRYLQVAADVYQERKKYTQGQIERARNLLEQDQTLSEEKREQLEYYILLTETYLAEMDFLADQIESDRSIYTIYAMATAFRQVGREQVRELSLIIEGITQVGEVVQTHQVDSEEQIRRLLVEAIGEPFNIKEDEDVPYWMYRLSSAYLNMLETNQANEAG